MPSKSSCRSWCFFGFFCLALSLTCGCTDSDSSINRQQLLDETVARYNIPGVVFAESSSDGQSRVYATGMADRETNEPMATDMYFHIGSVTKTFTATSVLMLVDQGRLSLETTVDSILPDMLPGGDTITVRNLLMMRSGLSDYTENATFQNVVENDPLHKWSFAELAPMVEVDAVPDRYFAYRNINYVTLGAIIETVSGLSRADYIRQKICAPLGLEHTFVPANATMPENSAHGYLVLDDEVTDVSEFFDPSWGGAAGDMISTATDLLIWLRALDKGTLLSAAMHQTMFTMRGAFLHGGMGGYGCGVLNLSGAVGHGGDYNGLYTAALFSYQGHYMVVLANGYMHDTTGDATSVFFDLAHSFYPPSENTSWRDNQLDILLSLAKDRLDVPGITAQIRFKDQHEWTNTLGLAQADDPGVAHTWDWTGIPLTRDLHVRIASVTKSITATATLMLVDQGVLSLDHTLERWLPNVNISTKDRITIRQLLNHTSGIPDFIRNQAFFDLNFDNPLREWTLDERIAYGVPLEEPGSTWAYSNTGYILLGLIIEQVSGRSFGDFLQENLFDPLGMDSSSVPGVTDFSMPAPFAHGYTFNFNQLDGIPDVMPAEGWLKDLSVSNWQGMGYGNVISTPDDLMRWLEALTDGRLLSEESNGLMHEYVKTDPDDEDDLYGLGVESKNGYIGHDGDLPGYHTGAYAKDGHLFTVIMNGDSFFGRGYEVVNSLGMLLGL